MQISSSVGQNIIEVNPQGFQQHLSLKQAHRRDSSKKTQEVAGK
ncbi:hypothetical protein CASFOL_036166 [Castilleja foliolosa]|uniref:Uncharacterized protein n=1 Tax=Castilleja foliolosa TaxID=1961234 RepID=A0ABD3BVE9_9LAMI